MTDVVNKQTRSRMMAGIRGKDTRPERLLRGALHRLGLRYRLHTRTLPGSPDLFFSGPRAVVFVHGCFWHRHLGCRYSTSPASNVAFWQEKFRQNVDRDAANLLALRAQSHRVAVIWECELRSADKVERTARRLSRWLRSLEKYLEIPPRP